jgi:hypothetical protein
MGIRKTSVVILLMMSLWTIALVYGYSWGPELEAKTTPPTIVYKGENVTITEIKLHGEIWYLATHYRGGVSLIKKP